MGNLDVKDVPLAKVRPNPWNPNKQTDRQFEAEVESILDNGFVLPCIVRQTEDGNYEIVDGEHRWRGLLKIIDDGLTGRGNVPQIVKAKVMPSVVLDITEAQAKKLTIILNETRGRANIGDLSHLLAELDAAFGDDLIVGLPYTNTQLNEFIEMGKFDWDGLDAVTDLADLDPQGSSVEGHAIVALVDDDVHDQWTALLAKRRADLPSDPKAANGAMIAHLLTVLETS